MRTRVTWSKDQHAADTNLLHNGGCPWPLTWSFQSAINSWEEKKWKKNAKKVPLRFMISIFFCSNAFFSCLFGSIIQGVYLHAYTGHLYNNFYNDGNEKHSNNTHFFFFVRQTNSRIILYLLIQKNINTSSIKFVKNKLHIMLTNGKFNFLIQCCRSSKYKKMSN